MSGFYIHIPFCRKACRYCDFHFSVSLQFIPQILESIVKEMVDKQKYFAKFKYETFYIGGGTPSVLSVSQLSDLKRRAEQLYDLNTVSEISLEANPDDLNPDYLEGLRTAGFNRLSIGVQSFFENDLQLMNRSHNATQVNKSILDVRAAGFNNFNIDLIYGIPGLDVERWKANLDKTIELNAPHISAYHLTFEPGTVFDHWRKKGRIKVMDEEKSQEQFFLLKDILEKEGYIHYELSNFAKPGFFSKHNTNYWKGISYLGIGPSAHSFDQKRRFWNISSNKKYIEYVLNNDSNYYDYEDLTMDNQFNEYVLTGLRTMWGIDLNEIRQRFGDNYVKYTLKIIGEKINEKNYFYKKDIIKLSSDGLFLSDQIIAELFRI